MKTFLLILHKQTAETDELYKHPIHDTGGFFNNVFSHEFSVINRNYNGKFSGINLSQVITLKMLIYMFVTNKKYNLLFNKYDYLHKIIDHIFMDDVSKEAFFTSFSSAQRIYQMLNRFVYRWKLRRMVPINSTDIMMEDISENSKKVMTVVQNGQKFLFSIRDIINIMETALSNVRMNYTSPRISKNPYNNIPFSKAALFNMYYLLLRNCMRIPPLIQAFYTCGFSLKKFKVQHERLIRDVFCEKYVRNCDQVLMHNHIMTMLTKSGFENKIRIHKEFSKTDLLRIMMPYLKLYVNAMYSYTDDDHENYMSELRRRLSQLHRYNPIFGRKMIDTRTSEPCFPTEHPIFDNYYENFSNSHLWDAGAAQYEVNWMDDIDGDSDSDDGEARADSVS